LVKYSSHVTCWETRERIASNFQLRS